MSSKQMLKKDYYGGLGAALGTWCRILVNLINEHRNNSEMLGILVKSLRLAYDEAKEIDSNELDILKQENPNLEYEVFSNSKIEGILSQYKEIEMRSLRRKDSP